MGREINYSLGLDIGITSVGWSVINLDKNRIEDLGVRIFSAGENPKDGSSLALPRRTARGKRRLLRRKVYRIKRVHDLILKRNILSKDELDNLFTNNDVISVWEAREKGLNEKLSKEEWAKILINLCKRRGFKSNRKNEANNNEAGQILTSINNNVANMKEANARTVGEYIYNNAISSGDKYAALRNKFGEYNMCVSRNMIIEEIHSLFEKQRKFNNEFATDEIEDAYLGIFNSQRPYSKFEDLEKLVGFCTFEKKKYRRAPKNSISAEEFILYEGINKLSIINNGDRRKLTNEERELIIKEAFKKNEIKYTNLRSLLKLKDEEHFSTLTYSIDKSISKTENTKFVSLKGYHEIRKAIEYGVSKECWQKIKNNKKMLNDIAYVLTLGKTDEDIIKQLKLRNITDEEIIDSLLDISFSKFNNLSVEAIEKILPYMKEGYQYNEACEKAGYNFKAIYEGAKSKKLPVIGIDEIVNPVVNRALAQSRKVINSVIEEYGSPIRINIELARELAKNFKDRKTIEKEQKENRANVVKIREDLKGLMKKEPTGREVLKYRLWLLQMGECAYSQQQISINNLFDSGYCEIDHIIPFSRSFDDSLSNKVLVLGVENQRKGNRTPYEYFGPDEERWRKFEIWVNGSHLNYKKKSNLLKKKFSEEEQAEWKARNLQDTKYICKYIARYINNRLEFKPSASKQKVITINGRATAYLRTRWGLNKVREDGDKHHALDATVIAVTTQGMVQRISNYSKADELRCIRSNDEFIDVETGEIVKLEEYRELRKEILPRPWLGFSEELMLRLSEDPVCELKKMPIKSYDDEFIENRLRPVFISRVPIRKINGRLFKETIYSEKAFKDGYFVTKKKLTDLTEKDLSNYYNYGCDKILYDAISEKMQQFDFNAKKAFEAIFRKPTKDGSEGPVVRSIKIKTSVPFKDGIELNNGLAAKDGMVRIDIYKKDKQYYAVPVYRYQLANGVIPKKAALAAKPEEKWPTIDDNYSFIFSIYKNDLIEIKYKKKNGYFGYFDGFDRATASISIEEHDSSQRHRSIGIKSDVIKFNKYEVDVLGNYHKVKAGEDN